MDNRDTNMTFGNTLISWGIAGLAGFFAFLLLLIIGEWSLSAAGFGGGAIALVLIVIFTIIFGRDLPPLGTVAPPRAGGGTARRTEPSSATATRPSAAASPTAAVAAGSAGMGGGSAAATSPAATGTPVGQGADSAKDRVEADLAAAAARDRKPDAPAKAATAADEKVASDGTRPSGLDAPRGGKADDLKLIKGVGPKLERVCNDLGFWHFDQIAAWSDEEIAWVDENLEGFKGRVTRDEWVEQAKILAAGGETEFSSRAGKDEAG